MVGFEVSLNSRSHRHLFYCLPYCLQTLRITLMQHQVQSLGVHSLKAEYNDEFKLPCMKIIKIVYLK